MILILQDNWSAVKTVVSRYGPPTYITRLLPAVGNCSQLCYYVTAIMFPRDPTRRKQWAAALKREGFVATEYSRICSDHFTKESYNGSGRLNCSAVPTVFNFPDHLRLTVNKLRTCVIHAVVQWITFYSSAPSNHVTLAAMLA
ncbi:THAP domain containing 6 [Plakobranchus ocellatus]|uniref:THAP domain containing 6 n=1 Tax=Plakobranchus ocellatus TaxID=259542 RepID=A0AAV4A9M6_9GAST|nr:THAP domain containing 6 [Plakobranchus ocellatus]